MKVLWTLIASAALFMGVVVAAATGIGGSGGAPQTGLPLPLPGVTEATTLRDGAPVFVVRHEDGGVSVLSAVDTHLQRLVVFCPDSRTFVEPGPVSRWDEYGRYIFGPAPTGLAGYEVEVVDDELRVRSRLRPPGRAVDAVPVRGRPECYDNEGVGGLRHTATDLPPVVSVATAPQDGSFVRVTGLLHTLRDGQTRLCNAEPSKDTCPASAPRVLSAFHERSRWAWSVGSVHGTFLARGARGAFAEVAGPLQ